MSVGRVCIRDVDTADPDESVLVAARRMHSRNVGTLVVLGKAGEPVGLITDRDLTVRVLAESREPGQTSVDEVMTSLPRTVQEDASLEDALRIMRAGKFRRVPVVDSTNQLVGLLSLDDILELLAEEFEEIGGLLREESPRALAVE